MEGLVNSCAPPALLPAACSDDVALEPACWEGWPGKTDPTRNALNAYSHQISLPKLLAFEVRS